MTSNDFADESADLIDCPVCGISVRLNAINAHLDADCSSADVQSPPGSISVLADGNTDQKHGDKANDTVSAASSFFSPTQTRLQSRKTGGKQEILETPEKSDNGANSAKKRKIAESTSQQNRASSPKATRFETATNDRSSALPRGKEARQQAAPLAERVRPTTLDDFIGQEELVGRSGLLRGLIEAGRVPSLILWGSSGTGKTTLARIIAKTSGEGFVFRELSATTNNIADCKNVFVEATNLLSLTGKRTIVFLDEIHRFTKSQQDIFLPYVEAGNITLIGATTENPSFRINNALISRCRVFVLAKLTIENVRDVLQRALTLISSTISEEIVDYIAGLCDGDARVGLNLLDMVLSLPRETLSLESVRLSLKRTTVTYDMKGDEHYNCISAFHKSIRGSDVNASLYYLGRMLQGGEDPLYIARRMVRIASEDIGLSDVGALSLCSTIYTAVQQVGMPEADCILAQGVVYLAQSPKSVAVYKAYKAVKMCLRNVDGAASADIPLHIRNAPTSLMRELGYGKDYKYNPDHEEDVHQEYLPEKLRGHNFFEPDEETRQTLWSEMDEGDRIL